jgi:hypothetical protein
VFILKNYYQTSLYDTQLNEADFETQLTSWSIRVFITGNKENGIEGPLYDVTFVPSFVKVSSAGSKVEMGHTHIHRKTHAVV